MPERTTEYTEMTVEQFLEDFGGRRGMPEYDETKRFQIAEFNRDYVWTPVLKEGFIRDVLRNEPLPSLILCNNQLIDGGNRATTLWLYQNNRFKVDGKRFDELAFEEYAMWRRCKMPVTLIQNATDSEKADYYEKYNKGVVLSFGQKMENRKYRPLVDAAFSLIGHSNTLSPLYPLVRRVWSPRIPNGKTRAEASFAYRVIVASLFGESHFYPSWATASVAIQTIEHVDLTNLRNILTILSEVDPNGVIDPKRKKQCFQLFIGGMLYDSWMIAPSPRMTEEQFRYKWQTFFRSAYNTMSPSDIRLLSKFRPLGLQDTRDRCAAVSKNVEDYNNGEFRGGIDSQEDEEEDF